MEAKCQHYQRLCNKLVNEEGAHWTKMGLIFPKGSVESGSTDSFYKRYPCIRILQTDFVPMWGGGGENNANVIYEWPQSLLSWYSSSSKFAKSLIQVPLPRKSLHKSLSHVVLEGDFNEPQK